jgi:hypothetical protein
VCEGVAESGRVETVYNVEVAGGHTYFVGADGWGFAVWAHNAKYNPKTKIAQKLDGHDASGHSYRDHGSHMSKAKHKRRIEEGTKGDGSAGNPVAQSSSFNNNAAQEAAAKRAQELAKHYETGIPGQPVKFKFPMPNAGTTLTMKDGKLIETQTTHVFAKLYPDGKGGWDVRTMYPL